MTIRPMRRIPLAQPSIGERERELVQQVLRATCWPWARSRSVRGGCGRADRTTVRRRLQQRHGGPAHGRQRPGHRRGRRGHHDPLQLRGLGELPPLRASHPALRGHRGRHAGPGPGASSRRRPDRGPGPILPVHVFGRPCRIEELGAIAERDWRLIEDACEALGSRLGDRPLGSFGDASVFAFYPNKQITTGEGGMVVTDDPELAPTCAACATRVATRTARGCATSGSATTTGSTSSRPRWASPSSSGSTSSRRPGRVAAAYAELLGGRLAPLPGSARDESVDWFVYVVRLARASTARGHRRSSTRRHPSRPVLQPAASPASCGTRSAMGPATSR